MRKVFFFLCFSLFCFITMYGAHAASDEKEVIMTGIGTTEDKAKQQAYRSAIQSVIGSMVLSETIVENDTLMRDKILSHSDGYVVKATQVGATRPLGDGLLEVTMRITVKSEQLKAKLKAENITMAAIDGQSLFAQKTTQAAAKQDAAAIVKEKVKDLPASVLMAEAHVQGSTQKASGDMVQLTIPIQLSVNQDVYKQLITDMKATLTKLGFEGKTQSLEYRKDANSHSSFAIYALMRSQTGAEKNSDFSQYNFLGIGEVFSASNIRMTNYYLPEEVALAFQSSRTFSVLVELMDSSGTIVTSQTLKNTVKSREQWAAAYGISNFFTYTKKSTIAHAKKATGSPAPKLAAYILPTLFYEIENTEVHFIDRKSFSYPMTFDLSDEELKSITSVKCTVVNTDRKE